MPLAELGIILFIGVVLFQLITLPVEFDASKRAIKILDGNGILGGEELTAMTYVAALFTSILQLLRLVLIVQGNGRRRS